MGYSPRPETLYLGKSGFPRCARNDKDGTKIRGDPKTWKKLKKNWDEVFASDLTVQFQEKLEK